MKDALKGAAICLLTVVATAFLTKKAVRYVENVVGGIGRATLEDEEEEEMSSLIE